MPLHCLPRSQKWDTIHKWVNKLHVKAGTSDANMHINIYIYGTYSYLQSHTSLHVYIHIYINYTCVYISTTMSSYFCKWIRKAVRVKMQWFVFKPLHWSHQGCKIPLPVGRSFQNRLECYSQSLALVKPNKLQIFFLFPAFFQSGTGFRLFISNAFLSHMPTQI